MTPLTVVMPILKKETIFIEPFLSRKYVVCKSDFSVNNFYGGIGYVIYLLIMIFISYGKMC